MLDQVTIFFIIAPFNNLQKHEIRKFDKTFLFLKLI